MATVILLLSGVFAVLTLILFFDRTTLAIAHVRNWLEGRRQAREAEAEALEAEFAAYDHLRWGNIEGDHDAHFVHWLYQATWLTEPDPTERKTR